MTITSTRVIMPQIIVIVSTITSSRRNFKFLGSINSGGVFVMSFKPSQVLEVSLSQDLSKRIDKALCDAVPEKYSLSRSRIKRLIEIGCVVSSDNGLVATSKTKTVPLSNWDITLSSIETINMEPENIPIQIVYEDNHLIVINKSVGMVVHPAPGSPNGTLVNALMYHFGSELSAIGGKKRPGIVHRIDKDTSGLLVIAKSDVAHAGLAAQFEAHTVSRHYTAFCYGIISILNPRLKSLHEASFESSNLLRISGNIARHRFNRKKMAIYSNIGRSAVTRAKTEVFYGNIASKLDCWLETGRTHQIRAHLAHIGHGLIGDPVYGNRRKLKTKNLNEVEETFLGNFKRQALHARTLSFEHPVTKQLVSFKSDLPEDLQKLEQILKKIS